jgi:ferredoxin
MERYMNVSVDRSECISCSLCWTDCPEIFEADPDDGLSRIVEKYRISGNLAAGEIPESLGKPAQSASDNCPVSVIHVQQGMPGKNDTISACIKPFDSESARLADKDDPCSDEES